MWSDRAIQGVLLTATTHREPVRGRILACGLCGRVYAPARYWEHRIASCDRCGCMLVELPTVDGKVVSP